VSMTAILGRRVRAARGGWARASAAPATGQAGPAFSAKRLLSVVASWACRFAQLAFAQHL